jgi:hypothetical protein
MKVDLTGIVQKSLKMFNPTIKSISKNKIKISYHNEKGNDPKPFIFPRYMKLDEELSEMIGCYLGDGKMSHRDLLHLHFVNTDPDVVKFMLDCFIKRFGLSLSDFTFVVNYRHGTGQKAKEKWSKILNIPKKIITTRFSENNKADSFSFQINGKIFTVVFKYLIFQMLPRIISSSTLRCAFLRGHFAADGGIAIKKDVYRN